MDASVVAFGAWAIGGWMWGGTNEKDSIRAIHAALDSGINFIDTAPVYGFGVSEELVGRAIRGRRDKVVLATKCGLVTDPDGGQFKFNATAAGYNPNGIIGVYVHLSADSIRKEVEASLKRLGTDTIDLYQTHWQEDTTPIEETMSALMQLRQEGKIRAIGISNASAAQLKEYQAVGNVDSDQERFSMLDRGIEADQLPYCRERGIAVLAYSPLGQGLLTGKMTPDREFEEGDLRRGNPRFSVKNRERAASLIEAFGPIAEKHGITPVQLAIAWTVHQPGLTHALCGARTAEQAMENAGAGDVELHADDLAAIDKAIKKHHVE